MSDSSKVPAATSTGGSAAKVAAIATVVVTLAIAGGVWILDARAAKRSEALAAELSQLRATTALMRLEAGSVGKGVGALIEQIELWAPELAKSSTPMPTTQKLIERLEEVLDAVEPLGQQAFDRLVQHLEQGTAAEDVEVRKWLLRTALRADPERGEQLLAELVRGNRVTTTTRLRFVAADLLTQQNKARAGEVLHQVLQVESHTGVTRQPAPDLVPEYERRMAQGRSPDFFNFIPRYVATGHAEVESTLLMLIGRSEHDRLTYQECIRQLGTLGSAAAVDRIKELYLEMPRREFNPLFQNVCIQAIADIQGGAACPWFQEQLRTTDVPLVSARLRELVKQHCSN